MIAAALDIVQLEQRRRALLDHAADSERQAAETGGARRELILEARAARARARELAVDR